MTEMTAIDLEKKAFIPEKLDNLEKFMLEHEQEECPVFHSFGPSIYMREVHLKKDNFVIGHFHNFAHMNIFVKGKMKMLNDDGTVSILTAPMSYVGKPGRKVAYILEDAVWINIYSETEQDVEKLEAKLLTKSIHFEEQQKLLGSLKQIKSADDQKSYSEMLISEKVLDDDIKSIFGNSCNPMPFGVYKYKLGDSKINGVGVFATAPIEKCETIGLIANKNGFTSLGHSLNHSNNPNCFISSSIGDFYLSAGKNISGCCGGNDGDELTIDYREIIDFFKEKIK